MLDSRLSILDSGPLESWFSILDSRFWILDRFRFQTQLDKPCSRFSIRHSRFSILDSLFSILDSRFSVLDSRFWILDRFRFRPCLTSPCSRFWTLDAPFWIRDSRFSPSSQAGLFCPCAGRPRFIVQDGPSSHFHGQVKPMSMRRMGSRR